MQASLNDDKAKLNRLYGAIENGLTDYRDGNFA